MEPKDEYVRKALAHRQTSGAGQHADKRSKRAKTRAASKSRAFRDQGC